MIDRAGRDRRVDQAEAGRLGLKVRSDMPEEILQLMGLYPQPVRRQPTVEYLPVPRRAERGGSKDASQS